MISNNKINVLQIVPSLGTGGVERGVVEISKALMQEGHKSTVVSSGGTLIKDLISHGAMHSKINAAAKNPITIWSNYHRLLDIINRQSINIIHARSRAPAWSAYLAAKKAKIPFVTTFHGVYNFSNKLKKFYNSIMTKGDKVIAVSNFVRNHILENYGIPESKIQVIHRGVDYDYFDSSKLSDSSLDKNRDKYRISNSAPVILLPSRFSQWKGQMLLIEALNLIKDLDFYCIMTGNLSKHPHFVYRLKSKIEAFKLQKKVQIFASERDMRNLYGLSSIVVSASIEPEAFGRTIPEAQAMEKIVIASNIGGALETIQDQVSGIHFLNNDARDLANKIQYALSLDEKAAKKLTNSARQSVISHFSLKSMQQKISL